MPSELLAVGVTTNEGEAKSMPCGGWTWVSMGWVVSWFMLLACPASHAAEHYTIAPQKSQVQFKAYSVLAKPLGKFHTFSGEILADAQQPSVSQVRLVIEAQSIDMYNARRDKHLCFEHLLTVEM